MSLGKSYFVLEIRAISVFLIGSLNMAPEKQPQDFVTTSLLATCHCGRVQIKLPKPPKLNECHCTVCYKYGSLWAYFQPSEVTIKVADDTSLAEYSRSDGDGSITFNRCCHCGCMVRSTFVLNSSFSRKSQDAWNTRFVLSRLFLTFSSLSANVQDRCFGEVWESIRDQSTIW